MSDSIFSLERGTAPLLISLPHDGSAIPATLQARMQPSARSAPDTDWFVSELYNFAKSFGASILRPHYSRYVIDLNRPPNDVSLYPGQNTTGLCPLVQFTGEPVYLDGQAPTPDEIQSRIESYWQPYHEALAAELVRLRRHFSRVVLWEGHSIRSSLPYLFDGQLPDLNLGTVNTQSCSEALEARLAAVLSAQTDYSHVVNGRFKGGYITRYFGVPSEGVEAVQLELAQSAYMDEAGVVYTPEKAEKLQKKVLQPLIEQVLAYVAQG